MKIFRMHLNNYLSGIFVFLFFACGEAEQKNDKNYVARIDSEILNEVVLDSIMNSEDNKYLAKSEIIRNWIDSKVLYKAAVEDSLIYGKNYQNLLRKSAVELANAMFLNNKLSEFEPEISYMEIIDFYEDNKDEFKSFYKSYFIKRADFNSYEKALFFRKEVFNSGWINSYNKFKNEKNVFFSEKLIEKHNILPVKLKRLVNNLMEDEVSIILKTELNQYSVVQLVRKINKNEIPELKYISDEVRNRLLLIRKKQFINEIINDLYIKYQVETFKDSL